MVSLWAISGLSLSCEMMGKEADWRIHRSKKASFVWIRMRSFDPRKPITSWYSWRFTSRTLQIDDTTKRTAGAVSNSSKICSRMVMGMLRKDAEAMTCEVRSKPDSILFRGCTICTRRFRQLFQKDTAALSAPGFKQPAVTD